ncbi:hypothetical protein D3C86_979000 [compost metagenome]
MKKLAVFFILGLSLNTNAQEISVEKSFFEIQTGFVGLWINNESKLSNSLVLRSELGLGYRIVFLKENYSNGYSQNVDDSGKNQNQYVPYLHLRFGYTL